MSNVLRLATIFGLLLGAGLFAVSCTGDDNKDALTLEEFFVALEAVDDDLEAKSAEIDAEGEALGEDATVDDAVGISRQQVDLIEGFVSDLEALDPPSEAEDLLAETVSASGEVVQTFNEQLDEAEGSETLDEFFGFFEGETEAAAALERLDQVCLDLEQLAADNDITIDLHCENE